MDAKISATFWSDPDLDVHPQEFITVLTWMKTNPDRNDCGAYRFSASRFSFQTKLDAAWHEKVLAALPDRFVRDGHWVLYLPFIGECLQLGEVVGKNGGINRGAIALTKPFQALTKPLQGALRGAYPAFNVIWNSTGRHESHYQALAKPLETPEAQQNGVNPSLPDSEKSGCVEGLAKPLASRRAEQHSTEQSRAEQNAREAGEEPVLPTVEEVIAFGQGPLGIPEEKCRDYHARNEEGHRWIVNTAQGPKLRDWRKELARFWVKDRPGWQSAKKNAGAESAEELRQQIESESDPAKKKALLRKLTAFD